MTTHVWIVEVRNEQLPDGWEPCGSRAGLTRAFGREELRVWKADRPEERFHLHRYDRSEAGR